MGGQNMNVRLRVPGVHQGGLTLNTTMTVVRGNLLLVSLFLSCTDGGKECLEDAKSGEDDPPSASEVDQGEADRPYAHSRGNSFEEEPST
jgi:hypothetical protein